MTPRIQTIQDEHDLAGDTTHGNKNIELLELKLDVLFAVGSKCRCSG